MNVNEVAQAWIEVARKDVYALSIADVLAGIGVSRPFVYKIIAANKLVGPLNICRRARSPIGAREPVGIIAACGFVD